MWPKAVEEFLESNFVGFILHLCCGKSRLGDIRLDLYEKDVDVIADASKLPFGNLSVDTVLVDPPYNGVFQWNHDLLSELCRVARKRIIFQHWFVPVNKYGYYRKDHSFYLSSLTGWMPKSYFGRMQMISIFDRED